MGKKKKATSNQELHEIKNKKRLRAVKDKKQHVRLKRVKSRRKAKAAASLLLVGVVVLLFAFMGGDPNLNSVSKSFLTVCYELPADGSTPLDHTALENIGYMNYRLKKEPQWYSYSHTDVVSPDNQSVDTYKQYSNGILIQTDTAVDTMGLVHEAQQFCWVLDEPKDGVISDFTDGVAMWRTTSKHKDTWSLGPDIPWDEWNERDYSFNRRSIEHFTYGCVEEGEEEPHKQEEINGLPGTAFSVYVINEQTVLESSAVIDNGDGTYSQSFDLRTDYTGEKDDSAVCHYRNQMVFKGGLDELPSFSSVKITYTFDSTWRVLSSTVQEKYNAKKTIAVSCTGTNLTEYTYPDDSDASPDLFTNPAYENYFVHQYDKEEVSKQLTASDCFTQAFGTMIAEPTSLQLALDIDGYRLEGIIGLDLSSLDMQAVDLSAIDVRANFQNGAIRLWFVDSKAYLAYGGMKIKLDVGSLLALLGGEAETASDSEEGGFSLDSILEELIGEKDLEFYDEGRKAKFTSSLNLSALIDGLNISELNFYFNIAEDKTVTLDCLDALIEFGGLAIGAEMSFTDQALSALEEAEKSQYIELSPYVESIVQLLNEDVIDVAFAYGHEKFDLNGKISLSYRQEFRLAGEFTFTYGEANKQISFAYINDTVYLKVDGIRVKANVAEAEEFIKQLIDVDGAASDLKNGLSGNLDFNLAGILEKLLSEEFNAIVIAEQDKELNVAVKLTQIFEILGIGFDGLEGLGNLSLSVSQDGKISIDALGAFVTLSKGESVSFETDGYADITELIQLIPDVLEKGALTLSGSIDIEIEDTVLSLALQKGIISWKNGFNLYLDLLIGLNGSQQNLILSATEQCVKVAYGRVGVNLEYGEFATLDEAFVKLYNQIDAALSEVIAQGSPMPEIRQFSDLLTVLKTYLTAKREAKEEGGTDAFSIEKLIRDIQIVSSEEGICKIIYKGITLEIFGGADGVALDVSYQGNKLNVFAYFGAGLFDAEMPQMPENVSYLTVSDFAVMLDYVGAAVQTLTQHDISVTISGQTVNTKTAEEITAINGNILYHTGEDVLFKIDTEEKTLIVTTNLYLNVSLNIISKNGGKSTYLDLLIFDYNADDELDFFVTLSMFKSKEEDARYNPLKLYAPAGEIMTVLSAGLAVFGVNADILNDYMIYRWLQPETTEELLAFGAMLQKTMNPAIKLGGIGGNGENETVVLDVFINSVKAGDIEFSVNINSASVYGIEGLEDISVTVTKENGYLKNISILNIYDGKAEQKTNVSVGISVDEISSETLVGPVSLDGYFSLNGIGALLKVIANTATHEETSTVDGKEVSRYVMNNNFYIDGNIALGLKLIKIFDITINVKVAVSIDLDEDGNVLAKVQLNYEGYGVLGQVAINGDSQLNLAIDLTDSMVYMKRVQTSVHNGWSNKKLDEKNYVTEYRAMPLDIFFADILNQLGFMLNFGSIVTKYLPENLESSGTSEVVDYGTTLQNYLSAFVFNGSEQDGYNWAITLNGAALTGGTLKDIVITLASDAKTNTLKTLGVNTKIDAGTGALDINLVANLALRNPNGVMQEGVTDNVEDITQSLKGAIGKAYNEAQAGNWKDENGKNIYISGVLTTVTFMADETVVSTQSVLYNGKTFELYAELKYPDLSEYEIEGYTLVWEEIGNTVSPNQIITAHYTANLYDVRFVSSQKVADWVLDSKTGLYIYETQMFYGSEIELYEGDEKLINTYIVGANDNVFELPANESREWLQAEIYKDGARFASFGISDKVTYLSAIDFTYDGVTYSNGYVKNFETDYTLFEADKITAEYTFMGWYMYTESGWTKIENFAFSEGNAKEYVVEALWQKSKLNIDSVDFRKTGSWSYTSYITVHITDCEFVGAFANDTSVIKNIKYSYVLKTATVGQTVSGESDSNEFSVKNSFNIPNGVEVTATVTYTASDGTKIYQESASGKS